MGTFKAWHRGSLSLVHLSVLAALEARSPLSMSEAAEALDVSIASATGIVDRMEKRQLVRRRHAADDRRVVFIELTDAGGKVFRDLEAQRRVRLGRLVEELNDEELAGFLGGLRALHAARVRLLENGVDPAKGPAAGGRAGSEAEAARP
jgi:DNA-binding MarR family transcriptional regulator